MAKIFPLEAKNIAFFMFMPLSSAVTKLISELNGRIVAAKKADKKRANSAICFSRKKILYCLQHPL